MSEFVAIVFDSEEDADRAVASVQSLQAEGKLRLNDSAVIRKDADGKIHRKDQVSTGVKTGAIVGGIMGLLLFVLFPVAGLVGGAVVGGLLGKAFLPGLDEAFTKQVAADLQPGGSAVFLLLAADPAEGLLVAAMRPYSGRIYQTSLSEETEARLAEALKKVGS